MPGPNPASARPATYGELFAGSEFRAVYSAATLSWIGDYLARAAVTALVLHITGSVVLSASSFAIGYLPSLTAGPVLAALVERHPPRVVMVTCDAARMVMIGVVAIPGVPVPVLFVLLFLSALAASPFEACRSSLLPRMLGGERYIVAISAFNTTNSLTLVLGYFVGSLAGSTDPHLTLAIDAATFALSGALIRWGVGSYGPNMAAGHRTGLLRETRDGFRMVLGNHVPRSIIFAVLGGSLMAIVPEGLAAAWAARLSPTSDHRALYQALIMMSVPAGGAVAAIVIGRLVRPETRRRLIRPFTLLVPLAMIGVLADPSAAGVTAIGIVVGFAMTSVVIPANAMYVRAIPVSFRARAFGVMQFGAQIVQGGGLIVSGALVDGFPLHLVIGYWGVAGLILMILTVAQWPSEDEVEAATQEAAATAAEPTLAAAAESDVPIPAPARRRALRGASAGRD